MILTLIAENASYCAVPIMAIIAAAGAIYSIGKGISQDAKAKKMEKGLRRPEYNAKPYEIPKEVDQYLQKAKMEALDQKLPGQQVMEERIGSATSNAVAATQQSGGSSAEVLNTVASIQSGENRAMNELNVLAAQDQIRKQANVDQALSTKAEYQDRKYGIDLQNADKAFQVNQYDPYKEKAAAISALKGASSQNIYGGIQGISSVAMAQMQYGDNSKKTKPPVTGKPYAGAPMANYGQGVTPAQQPIPNYQDYYRQATMAASMPQYNYNGPYRPEYGQPVNSAQNSIYYPRAY